MTQRMYEPWIETYSGIKFYFLEPTPDMININDIAQSLSRQCRFSGHLKKFLSVAEHSILVSRNCDNKLHGLLHDASEAYLLDVPSPIKQYLLNYKELEAGVMKAILEAFGLDPVLPPDVHDADTAQLKAEAIMLLPSGGKEWIGNLPTQRVGLSPKCWNPDEAARQFKREFEQLMYEYQLESA